MDVSHPEDGLYHVEAFDKYDKKVLNKVYRSDDDVANFFGKDLGNKMKAVPIGKRETLEGVDLDIGGDGMKAFYDRELISIANKIAKKLGLEKVRTGKFDEVIDNADPSDERKVHYLDLPKDKLKVRELAENLTLYMPSNVPEGAAVPPVFREIDNYATGKGTVVFDSVKEAIDKEVHGSHVQKPIRIDNKLADKLFLPASAAFFDPGFSTSSYIGKIAFAMMADRMRVGTYTSRAGNDFELRGGPDHPDMPLNQQKVAWAASGNGARELESAILRTDGIGLVVVMYEMSVASNRTFARIMLDELKYDEATNPKARKRMAKQIREASVAVRKYARKSKPKFAKYEGESLAKIEAEFDQLPYDIRKVLFSQIASQTYKSKTGGIFWRDLARDLIAYKDSDGYRTGDIVKVIQFDQKNPTINLADLGIPKDPTYDISFAGKSISNVKGRVSAFQVFKDQINLKALEENKPGQIISPEGVVGPQSFSSLFFGGLSDPRLSRTMDPGSLDPRQLSPIQFKAKTGGERESLNLRQSYNQFMPQSRNAPKVPKRFRPKRKKVSTPLPAAFGAAATVKDQKVTRRPTVGRGRFRKSPQLTVQESFPKFPLS